MGSIPAHGAGAQLASMTVPAPSAHRCVTDQRTRSCNGGNTYSFVSSYIDSTYYISLVSSFARRFEFENMNYMFPTSEVSMFLFDV